MSRLQTTEQRRMRPLLGTFVEVRVCGLNARDALAAIDGAFNRITKIEERMSAHDSDSDLGRIFRAGNGEAVTVHPWTFEVIEAARELHQWSDGIFDITIGDALERDCFLPAWPAGRKNKAHGTMADIELLAGNLIRLRRPVRLDLGGIAKGFAVDRAVEALMEAGVKGGCVNAGGDFRIFGNRPEPLLIRDPIAPSRILRIGKICQGAVATSGGYFRRRRKKSRTVTPLVDGRTRQTRDSRESITVVASSGMWADALTKVLAIDRQRGAALLNRLDAGAVLISGTAAGSNFDVLPSPDKIHASPQWNETYGRFNESRE